MNNPCCIKCKCPSVTPASRMCHFLKCGCYREGCCEKCSSWNGLTGEFLQCCNSMCPCHSPQKEIDYEKGECCDWRTSDECPKHKIRHRLPPESPSSMDKIKQESEREWAMLEQSSELSAGEVWAYNSAIRTFWLGKLSDSFQAGQEEGKVIQHLWKRDEEWENKLISEARLAERKDVIAKISAKKINTTNKLNKHNLLLAEIITLLSEGKE